MECGKNNGAKTKTISYEISYNLSNLEIAHLGNALLLHLILP